MSHKLSMLLQLKTWTDRTQIFMKMHLRNMKKNSQFSKCGLQANLGNILHGPRTL